MPGLYLGNDDGTYTPLEIENVMSEPAKPAEAVAALATPLQPDPELARLRAENDKLQAEARQRAEADARRESEARAAQAKARADAPIAARKLDPAQREPLERLYAAALASPDPRAVADLDAVLEALPARPDASQEKLANGPAKVVASVQGGEDPAADQAAKAARRAKLLKHTPDGEAALRREAAAR